jgi:phosphoribosylformylglycinamidine synthase II
MDIFSFCRLLFHISAFRSIIGKTSGERAVRCRRIEITVKPELDDPFAGHICWEISSTLGYRIDWVRTVSVYTVCSELYNDDILRFARDVLCDPVLSFYAIDRPAASRLSEFMWALEVSFKPGVTDNVGKTATDVLKMMDSGCRTEPAHQPRVYRSTQYLIHGDLSHEQALRIGSEILYNELIEDIDILHYTEFVERGGFQAVERSFVEKKKPRVEIFHLHVPDEELLRLSYERTLALTLEEMRYFRRYFDREDVREARKAAGIGKDPTDVELECFAQTQSEHCKHKIFNAHIEYRENGRVEQIHSLFKTYISAVTKKLTQKKGWLKSVFTDNAGVVRFDDRHNLAFKVETHNSPSALDPYGGAITGIVGCDRDPAGTGMGSRLVAHTDVLCFGDPAYSGTLPPRMMHPKRIMEGVITGIEHGGNKCGIPTVNGGVIFDDSYSGKPLVFCGSVGIMPDRIGRIAGYEKAAKPGDVIVMVGGRIGKDGIHGATFSSEEIKESSPAQAVQIGDPITQKKMLDMLIEARDELLYKGITDNGAGGLSSSVGEMARLSGGAFLELEKAPLKYPGLDPWEILLSEAQERMTLAVPKKKLKRLLDLAALRDVCAVPIGEFTDTGFFHVTYKKKTVCLLHLDFLHSQIPFSLQAEWKPPRISESPPGPVRDAESQGAKKDPGADLGRIIVELVSDVNSCSREPLIRRFDHEVQGTAVVKPLVGPDEAGPSDGGAIAPVYGSRRGFVLACGINPFYSRVDTYHMAAACVDEALRNAVTVGADPDAVALLDNFCWPDPVYDEKKTPDGKYKLAQLVRAARGLHDTAVAYGAPFISGKDSMKNDYKIGSHKVSVLPTILVSALGIVPDISKCVTADFKSGGDAVYLLGKTGSHMGESLFFRKFGWSSSRVPEVSAQAGMALYRAYFSALQQELVASGHDLSEGGLAVSVAECCIAGEIGAEIELGQFEESALLTERELLFSESCGRILVTVRPECERSFVDLFKGLSLQRIGRTTDEKTLSIRAKGGRRLCSIGVQELKHAYREPLFRVLGLKP